jgi:hypothetical protein
MFSRGLGLLLLLWPLLIPPPQQLYAQNPDPALDWLLSQQAADGGWYESFTERSGAAITAQVSLALWAAGIDPASLDPSPIQFLKNYTNRNAQILERGLALQLAWLALVTEEDPRRFGGVDLLALIAEIDPASGLFGASAYEHCYSVLILAAWEETIPPSAYAAITDRQGEAGGWAFSESTPPDTVTTSLCLQALLGTANAEAAIMVGLDFLRAGQLGDGTWPFQPGEFRQVERDAYSTAWALMALRATNQDLAAWGHPERALASLQLGSGAYDYSPQVGPDFDLLATAWVLIAQTSRPGLYFPVFN